MFEEGAAFPVRVQSEAELSVREPWQIEAWENPFARDGPASPFLAGEPMLEWASAVSDTMSRWRASKEEAEFRRSAFIEANVLLIEEQLSDCR